MVGVDLAVIEPPMGLANVVALSGDISEVAVRERLLEALGGPADVLLSDAAPKLTGVRATDRAREEVLLECVEAALASLLCRGGALLVKLLQGPEAQAIEKRLKARFETAHSLRPAASRKGTSERYLLGLGLRAQSGLR